MPRTSNSILCDAPREAVYRIISQSSLWPEMFEPCLAVRADERSPLGEDIEITALVNGTEARWRSRRTFLPDIFGVDSTALDPMPLMKRMDVTWRVLAVGAGQCALVLEHDFDVADDVAGLVEGVETAADALAYLERAIEANSARELENIGEAAAVGTTRPAPRGGLRRTCSILCEAPAARAYAAVADWRNWPLIFDSCFSARLVENGDAGELVRMEALLAGRVVAWTTRRRYRPELRRIDFELDVPMPFIAWMEGHWVAAPLGPGRSLLGATRVFEIREAPGQPSREAILSGFEDNSRAEMLALKALVERDRAAPRHARRDDGALLAEGGRDHG